MVGQLLHQHLNPSKAQLVSRFNTFSLFLFFLCLSDIILNCSKLSNFVSTLTICFTLEKLDLERNKLNFAQLLL